MNTADPTSARRIELILEQVESLPTLPVVAMKLLKLTSDEGSAAQEVIETVKADPSLTAKILALCKNASVTAKSQALTIDKAVVLLGFETIRNAVLSIKVFESFSDDPEPGEDDLARFSRPAFWRHCLATAIAAELIADQHREMHDLDAGEAFVCGLLHGIGKLALEHVLPKSYQRVIELTEQTNANIAEIERRILGIDHHTAGKRLAEKWNLPHLLCDCFWLYESPFRSLPDVEHKRMIALVGLADLVVRKQHIGYSGNYQFADDVATRAEQMGLDPTRVATAAERIIEELENRTKALGLAETPTSRVFLDSIMSANDVLGRLNTRLENHRSKATRQTKAIESVTRFHANAASSARSLGDVMAAVISSANASLGVGTYAMIYQPSGQTEWQINQYNTDGNVTRSELVEPPPGVDQLTNLTRSNDLPVDWMAVLPWLSDYLMGFADLRKLRLLALPCAWGTAAVIVHDQQTLPPDEELDALAYTWGSSVGSATQHEGARRLSEQLAESNRVLTETQDSLLRHRSLARLGEMAAGAAHEMNNPLAVISGRAQLLAMHLSKGSKDQQAAAQIFEQSQKLSDMITALHLFAEPPQPQIRAVSIDDVMQEAVQLMRKRNPKLPALRFNSPEKLPPLRTDKQHLAAAISELMLNAYEANPRNGVKVATQVDPLDNRLILKVVDDGVGMDAHTLEHAFDPFFSAKPAGRQPGLGLARAQRFVESIGGRIELISQPDHGTTATILLPIVAESEKPMDHAIPAKPSAEENGENRVVDTHP